MNPIHSVIVPVHNGASFIHLLWNSLVPNLPDRSEIIVVDDGSSEEIARLVPTTLPSGAVRVLRNESARGYAHAINRGAAEARGQFLYLLNTDLILGDNALRLIHSHLEKEPRVGVVGAKLLYPQTGRIQHFGLAFSPTRKLHVFTHMKADHSLVSRFTEFQAVTFALCGLRREIFLDVGELDSHYINGCEDIDYCLRVREKGYRLVIPPDVSSYHWESLSGESRHISTLENEARFWGTWASRIKPDIGAYLEYSLAAYLQTLNVESLPEHTIVNLVVGSDYLDAMKMFVRKVPSLGPVDFWDFSRSPRNRDHIFLPMVMPPDAVRHPRPFLFIVYEYPLLAQNHYWYGVRKYFREDDLVLDLYGNVLPAPDALACSSPERIKAPLDAS